MGIKINGLDKLNKQLKAIPGAVEKASYGATYDLTELIAGKAAQNVQQSTKHGNGELAGDIRGEVDEIDGKVSGSVFTNLETGMFREFGTGPNGEASTKDLPEGINPTYTQDAWFFPVDSVDENLNDLYGIPIVEIKGKKFYRTSGQPARPWLYPAYKEGMEDAEEIYKEHFEKALKEVAK